MRMDHTLQVPASFLRPPFQTLMHNDIVKYKIEYAIAKNPKAHGNHVRVKLDLRIVIKQGNRGNAEYKCKQVVLFQYVIVDGVVRLVPAPKDAVHDKLVREPCDALPQQERASGNQNTKYDLEQVHGFIGIKPGSC